MPDSCSTGACSTSGSGIRPRGLVSHGPTGADKRQRTLSLTQECWKLAGLLAEQSDSNRSEVIEIITRHAARTALDLQEARSEFLNWCDSPKQVGSLSSVRGRMPLLTREIKDGSYKPATASENYLNSREIPRSPEKLRITILGKMDGLAIKSGHRVLRKGCSSDSQTNLPAKTSMNVARKSGPLTLTTTPDSSCFPIWNYDPNGSKYSSSRNRRSSIQLWKLLAMRKSRLSRGPQISTSPTTERWKGKTLHRHTCHRQATEQGSQATF